MIGLIGKVLKMYGLNAKLLGAVKSFYSGSKCVRE